MPHLYSSEQTQIRNEARRLLERSGHARLRALLEEKAHYDEDFWASAKEMGWTGIGVAEDAGGLGLGWVDTLIVAEECGRALAAAPFLATGVAAAYVLATAGDPAGVLARVAAGELTTALAFAEGAAMLPTAPATRFADGKLTGTKTAVLAAAAADLAIVLASDSTGKVVLASVDLNGEGVTRQVIDTIDNSRCLADLNFANAPAALLATDAAELAQGALDRLALHLAAEGVGGTDACIAVSTAYANERQAFGQAIGKFQAVKHAIAEMYVQNEMARASVLDAAVRLDRGDPGVRAYIAAARLNAVQAYETAAAGATQVHGGIGVTWEADLHLHYRRSRAIATEAGAPPLWEDLIVSELITR